ncbi:MAG: CrcB family protein [Dermatophilaceae bacterium]
MPRRARLPYWREVAVGGAIGTAARIAVDLAIGPVNGGWDPGLAVVNILGAFALGWLSTRALSGADPARWRAFAGTGVLGAFTTFSALSLAMVDGTPFGAGLASLTLSVFGGVAGATLGQRWGAST